MCSDEIQKRCPEMKDQEEQVMENTQKQSGRSGSSGWTGSNSESGWGITKGHKRSKRLRVYIRRGEGAKMVLGLKQKAIEKEQKGVRVCTKGQSGQKGYRRWVRKRMWSTETEHGRKREERGERVK